MKNHPICVNLSKDQLATIDKLAQNAGINRSQYIRNALDVQGLSAKQRHAYKLKIKKSLDDLENNISKVLP